MADASFLDGEKSEQGPGWRGRRVLACVLVVLAAVSALMIHAAAQAPKQAKRERPRVLSPVESNVGVARVQVRGYLLTARQDNLIVYTLDDNDEKTKGTEEGKRLQQALSRGADLRKALQDPNRAGAAAKALTFSGMPGPGMSDLASGPGKDMKLKPLPLKRLVDNPELRPAERAVPLRAAILAASFPFRAQVEEHRAKLRLANAEAVLSEQGPDGMPTFRFLGVRVQRRTLSAAGKPLTPYVDLDLAGAYMPYLLLSGKRFEPEEPSLAPLIFPGLVMPRLLAFRPQQYPPVEMGLKTLRKALGQAPKPTAPPDAGAVKDADRDGGVKPPAAAGQGEVPPGIAKPRPEPVPPAVAKPRKAPPAKAAPAAAPAPTGMPEYCLLRILDPTVQPGQVYQYRLQVRMASPNFGRKDVAAPELAREKEIRSDWYEVPQKVTVAPELVYYAVDQMELDGGRTKYKGINRDTFLNKDRAALQIHRWLEAFAAHNDRRRTMPVGEWVVAERVIVHRGEYVGGEQRIEFPYWRTTQEQFVIATEPGATRRGRGVPVSFRPDRPDGLDTILVDFAGGPREYERVFRGLDETINKRKVWDVSATELLLLAPDGKMLAHEGPRDGADRERVQRLRQVRERLRKIKEEEKPTPARNVNPFCR
jgi:hypothetical protein